MKKVICDICKENEAAEHFRVQQSKKYHFPWGNECRYDYIDICQECYDKLTAHIPKPEPSPLAKAAEAIKKLGNSLFTLNIPDIPENPEYKNVQPPEQR